MTRPSPPDRRCPACHGDTWQQLTRARQTTIVQCTGCGLGTWDFADFDPGRFYDASYWQSEDVTKGYADYYALADVLERTHRARLRHLRRRLAHRPPARLRTRPARLLDVGCGPGFFVRDARRAGFEAYGVELSDAAVEHARNVLNLTVWQGRCQRDQLGDGSYDVITLWDVLEHLPDPAEALTAVAEKLVPNGLLVLTTGDITSLTARLSGPCWHLYTLPEHLWFHSPASVRHLLRHVGLIPVDRRYEILWYPPSYLLERLEAMFRLPRRTLTVPPAINRLSLPITLADIMTVIARRPDGDERSQ